MEPLRQEAMERLKPLDPWHGGGGAMESHGASSSPWYDGSPVLEALEPLEVTPKEPLV
jgi:hypothetical protein